MLLTVCTAAFGTAATGSDCWILRCRSSDSSLSYCSNLAFKSCTAFWVSSRASAEVEVAGTGDLSAYPLLIGDFRSSMTFSTAGMLS